MTELLTAAQMRAIEQAAIESGQVTGLELMERAGRGVVEAVFEEWPELAATSHRAVVLCGPGNNGGDGFVVARLLKEWGWEVEVFLYGDADKLPPDAKVNYERWRELGEVAPLTLAAFDGYTDRASEAEGADRFGMPSNEHGRKTIFIDAIFGTGLTRRFPEDLLELSRFWSGGGFHWEYGVSVDMPSGICSDSGRWVGGGRFHPRLCVTFHAKKLGHYLGDWMYDCHKLKVVDIGLSNAAVNEVDEIDWKARVWLDNYRIGGRHTYDSLHKELDANKFTNGHALILSGPSGKTGAARLAARGALRIGAGLVTVGCPPGAVVENASQLNAIMLAEVGEGAALKAVLADARINALCLGPGLGLKRAAGLVPVALGGGGVKPRPTVLDADALTVIAKDPALFNMLHDKCVLTPHAGEFARLFPDIAEKLNAPASKGPAYSKVDATREAAKRAGCVVLFKGADTVIAAPDGRASINSAHYERAAPWLATAGSGDVLAGFIAGLLARRFSPMQAAQTAAWLHVECALHFGPGLIAEDLPEQLPKVFRSLGV
ncbi:MAG TPA: NAD(P)H-hydrate dehydratase [Rhodobacteraceae bacterium]|nr:NAD(P)H-hydrate dehydratase [Paracoccaceae bacterium]